MISCFLAGMALATGQAPAAPVQAIPAIVAAVPADPAPGAPLPAAPAADATAAPAVPADNGSSSKDSGEKIGFFKGLFKAYKDAFTEKWPSDDDEPAKRRGYPEPFSSPPFPMHEFQGFPLLGVPPESERYPFMEAIYQTPWGDAIKDSRVKFYGWVTGSINDSTAKNSNAPTSYWVVPNRLELDQFVAKLEREVDSVQQDHIDVGFRSSIIYGLDYRYTTAGGWASDQLLVHNLQYGWDPLEQYVDVYFPNVLGEGMIVRMGRWVACPDIETQLAPDNYLGSHSILFTFDTYTQTGVMITQKVNDQWTYQLGINAGNDMAPWYAGAVPCGYAGVRWVAKNNKDAVYTVLNQIDDAKFSHFTYDGQAAGHDNFNYVVSTYEHVFSKECHTKTEGYFMWERDAEVGGTPSLGPLKPIGGGGGDGILIPGTSRAYGLLNYTMYAVSNKDFITFRNEVWRDETGFRSGFPGTYTSHTIGFTHNFNKVLQLRPEVGYYRNWNEPAFDLGATRGIWIAGADFTLRF